MAYIKLDEFPPIKSCNFCQSRHIDDIELGEIANLKNIYCHYFFLLLANKVAQRGNDDQCILRFLANDIKKEILRGKMIICHYCKKGGATIECSDKKYKCKFHLPCGLEKNSLHQFFGQLRSFCSSHRLKQRIPAQVVESESDCIVCQTQLSSTSFLWPECCKPSALIHRRCQQKMTLIRGYSFKCPLCNDDRKFLDQSKRLGIYIPEQEPSWEREEGAFEELLDRRISCELGTNCTCENGTSYSRIGTPCKLEPCNLCGSNGIHLACSTKRVLGSDFAMPWSCETCSSATSNSPNEARVIPEAEASEDEEIDVEMIDSDDEKPTLLSESLILPDQYDHSNTEPEPLESVDRLDILRSQVPIIGPNSEDELEDVHSISSRMKMKFLHRAVITFLVPL
ncbi:hypothetical protein GE061_000358 [Apolygus lucorum]|uniref:Uncharacterized protein n=1 Tax=Apolygus lucorum TaxID=248454 RepID=A0A6A4K0K6_APOLU|nr:hypothetical protein GE061_000358 [Apolygus lucorum]